MREFKRFNFFIGANNSGKSTVLNFISKYLPIAEGRSVRSQTPTAVDALDYHGGVGTGLICVATATKISDVSSSIVNSSTIFQMNKRYIELLNEVLNVISDGVGSIWVETQVPYNGNVQIVHQPDVLLHCLSSGDWHFLWAGITNRTGGSVKDWVAEFLELIKRSIPIVLPEIKMIPAIREVGPKDSKFENYSGAGLIDKIASIQNPSHHRLDDKAKFNKINDFLRYVTDKSDAEIEVPYEREHISVHMDGRVLPLSSLGTGIHEVIMIAAFCTLSDESIVCIEEPEIHLHPLLQRKLMAYLSMETSNQYFIATHSASFIDTPGAAIFHVQLQDHKTVISEAILRQERYAICSDLGHRASDIIQSNCVIWVEGPSDRIYLNYWIRAVDHALVEGIDYSIMFYGGRLLSHLAADDAEVSEFIQLRNLNRNVAVIMDSDKNSAFAKINDTKKRLIKDFSNFGVAWITKGREIENYIDHASLQKAVESVYGPAYGKPLTGGMYEHALHFERSKLKKRRSKSPAVDLRETDVDKVKVSKAVVENNVANLDILDLRERVAEVVELIRQSNA